MNCLGGVGGFDRDEAQGESDDGGEAAFGLLAVQADALKALEPCEHCSMRTQPR
jgi:hypothetical protein